MTSRFVALSALILLAGCNPVVGDKAPQGNEATVAPANMAAPPAAAQSNQMNETDGDALVPGTNVNATGTVRCVTRAGHSTRDCNAVVVRNRDGSAVVTIFSTEGQSRAISFDGRQQVSGVALPEGGARPRYEARHEGRTTMISFNGERYEIPDVMVAGDRD